VINKELIFGSKVPGLDYHDGPDQFLFHVLSFMIGLLISLLLFAVVMGLASAVSAFGWMAVVVPLIALLMYRVGRYFIIKTDILDMKYYANQNSR
jgi:lysylphosphatidylglycerol synthetase-like protein (DUF2156 family)